MQDIYTKILSSKKFRKIATPIILFAMVASTFFIWTSYNKEVEAGWWDDSWTYRKSIEVTNNTTTENNVYIELTLDTSATSTIQADCGDFRFTTQGGQILDYYIVSGCGTATNVIHINFETFPAGSQNIYFYYGNPTIENGFSTSDFAIEASNYTIGTVGSQEVGGGPVAYWNFDEGYGTTVYDSSSQGNNGTVTGATWQDESMCVSGKCLYFDGTNDYVNIPDSESLDLEGANQITLSAWIKPINLGENNNGRIIDKGGGSAIGSGYGMLVDVNNIIRFDVNGNSGDWHAKSENDSIILNDWQYIVAIYDNNLNTGRIYINGVEKTLDSSIARGTIIGNNYDLRIGIRATDLDRDFHGFIDEVKIYPYARTVDQIKQDYSAGLAGVSSPKGTSVSFGSQSDSWMSDGLVGYWKFDETATTSGAIDASGNGNDGTYYGNASTTGGKFGNGAVFDGDGDYIEASNEVNFDFERTDPFSFSTWINTGSSNNDIVSKMIDGGNWTGYSFFINANALGFNIISDTSPSSIIGIEGPQDAKAVNNKWHHVVATYDGSSKASGMKIYLDSVEVETSVVYDSLSSSILNNENLSIANGSSPLNGSMDELRIYKKELSPDEVKKLYKYAPGPVLHLKLDEKQGTTAYDTSGYGNNATIYGSEWSRGKIGSALRLDGTSSDRLELASNQYTQPTGPFTVSAWVKADGLSLWNGIIGNTEGSGWADGFGLYYNTAGGGQLQFYVQKYNENFAYVDFTDTSDWHHVSGVWDGTNVRIYLNGIEGVSGTYSGEITYSDTTYVGAIDSPNYTWEGSLDEVKIYNYARTQKQILEDMSAGRPAQKSPVAYYKFDEGYGATVHDYSINKNHGTASSSTSGTNTNTSQMWSGDGKYGKAMEFDGTDDFANLGNISGIKTISFWMKSSSTTEDIMELKETPWSCGDSIYNDNDSITYSTVLADDGNCWLASNLGTTNIATAYDDSSAYGDYYQWGRLTDGHQISTSGTTATLSTTDVPGHNDFITSGSSPYDWRNPQNDNLWQGVNGINNPCPTGWRLPTQPEWATVVTAEGITNYTTAASSNLKLSAAGYRSRSNGSLLNQGSVGYFWSSSPNGSNAYILIFHSSGVFPSISNNRASGLSVRCLQDSPTSIKLSQGNISAPSFDSPTIYVDGKESSIIGTDWHHVVIKTDTAINVTELILGRIGNNYYNGKIDEVKIFNYALTEEEIKTEYNRGSAATFGSVSTDLEGKATNSHDALYCVPGSADFCEAPVGEWNFDEKTGTTAYDKSGSGNNGTLTNGPLWERGKIGSALKFDGVDDYLTISNFQFSISNKFSISQFINFQNLATGKPIISQWGGNQNNILIKTDDSSSSDIKICIASSLTDNCTNYGVTSALGLETKNWYNIQVIYDGGDAMYTNADQLKLFIDGVQKTLSFTGTIPTTIQTGATSVLEVGGNSNLASYNSASIDEVKIYNYARTPAQIAWDYNKGAPIAHYRFDECEGDTVYDWSASAGSAQAGNNGTITIGAGGLQTTLGNCATATTSSAWYNGRNGIINNALFFDGVDDYVEVGNLGTSINSISFWSKQDYLSNYFLDLDGGTNTISLSNSQVTTTGITSPKIYINGIEKTSIPDNSWQHITIVTNTSINVSNMNIGRIGTDYYAGLFDEIKLFNYPLTNEQVKTNYSGGAVNFGGLAKETGSALVPSWSCGDSIYNDNDSITYSTVLADDGNCWLASNLGTTNIATAYNDSSAYGAYYQWGRLADGHQISTSGTTATLATSDVPGHGNFITSGSSPYDWRNPQNDNLWQGVNGINNPCPTGWRLPTQPEWSAVISAEGITNYTTAASSNLKLPAAGYRDRSNGSLSSQGSYGNYWSSSPNGANAYYLYLSSSGVYPSLSYNRALGLSVRCLQN